MERNARSVPICLRAVVVLVLPKFRCASCTTETGVLWRYQIVPLHDRAYEGRGCREGECGVYDRRHLNTCARTDNGHILIDTHVLIRAYDATPDTRWSAATWRQCRVWPDKRKVWTRLPDTCYDEPTTSTTAYGYEHTRDQY
eukprot:1920747-Rhodomonas_salina.3